MPPSPSKLNPQQAIGQSYKLLLQKGLEQAPGYDGASFLQIQFPDQNPGAFVVLGFMQPPHGYQFLYRYTEGQLELVTMNQKPGIAWGINSLHDTKPDVQRVDLEFIEIFAPADSLPRQTIKVTGSNDAQDDVWEDGYFEIIEITNTGTRALFTGAEFWTDQTMFDVRFKYKYLDSDSDGNIDFILETSDRCEYQIDPSTGTKQDFGCFKSQVIHQFDGTRFVEKIPP